MEFAGIKVGTIWDEPASSVFTIDAEREIKFLERRLAAYVGAKQCVLTPSGTAGLLTALRAAGVADGDGVMCTAFSFFSTAEIIALAGAVPVLVDTNPNTFNIDPYCIEYVLKKCDRTKAKLPKALVAGDLFGLPCDFDAIEEICARYDITLIEDMSGAFGASYKGRKSGGFGRFSVASFFPARPLGGIGDGGGVFCRSRSDADLVTTLRGKNYDRQPFDFVQASLAGEKLSNYSDEMARRQLVAARYRDNFKGYVKVQHVGDDYISAYTQFVVALADSHQRENVIEALGESHIPCSIPHCARREQSADAWERVVLTNTQQAAQRLLALPMHPYLSIHVVDFICECVMMAAEKS